MYIYGASGVSSEVVGQLENGGYIRLSEGGTLYATVYYLYLEVFRDA